MMTVIAKSIHDLLIDSITVYPSEPAIGDSVSVTVFVTDSGPEPTDASVLPLQLMPMRSPFRTLFQSLIPKKHFTIRSNN
jgi:hypothetical protein